MLVYPDPPTQPDCALLFVPVELVPIVGALLGQLEQRHRWATDADWEQGYRAFVDLQAQLMSNCMGQLVKEIRALRGIKPDYVDTPEDERTIDMYRSLDDLTVYFNTLIFGLTGGLPHDDFVLSILRGTVEASETRNVLDKLE